MELLGNILLVILGLITSISIIFMLYDFIKHEYKYSKHGFKFWRSSLDTIISVTILILYAIFAIHTTINRIYSIDSSINNSFNPIWCKSLFFELTQFTPSKLLLYQFYILRLHTVFKSSSFAVSTMKLKLIAIIGCHQYIISLQYDFNEFDINSFADCSIFNDEHTAKTVNLINIINMTLYILAEFIYFIIILRLFLSRVLLLTMSYDLLKASQSQMNSSLSVINRARSLSHIQSLSGSPTPPPLTTETDIDNIPKIPKTINIYNDVKNNELFLNLAIKTTNLIILVVCANYIVLFKFALKIPTAILNIDALCNCLSVYLSYQFSSKYYDILFSSFHKICYGCCVTLCYCCCLPTKLPPHLELEHVQKTDDMEVKETTKDVEEEQSVESVHNSRSEKEDISTKTDDNNIAIDIKTDNNNKMTVKHDGICNNVAIMT